VGNPVAGREWRSDRLQLHFSWTVWITFHRRGTTSMDSVTLSPIMASLPPQQGHAAEPGTTTRRRGSGRRTGCRWGKPPTLSWPVTPPRASSSLTAASRTSRLGDQKLEVGEGNHCALISFHPRRASPRHAR
jgi:hypothetical protein